MGHDGKGDLPAQAQHHDDHKDHQGPEQQEGGQPGRLAHPEGDDIGHMAQGEAAHPRQEMNFQQHVCHGADEDAQGHHQGMGLPGLYIGIQGQQAGKPGGDPFEEQQPGLFVPLPLAAYLVIQACHRHGCQGAEAQDDVLAHRMFSSAISEAASMAFSCMVSTRFRAFLRQRPYLKAR